MLVRRLPIPPPIERPEDVSQPSNYDREVASSRADTLRWSPRAKRLGQYLAHHVETPITIGIQGGWGSGKSSFINLMTESLGTLIPLEAQQRRRGGALAEHLQHYLTADPPTHAYVLRFDSWVFAQSEYAVDDLLPMYVSQVVEAHLRAVGRLVEQRWSLGASLGPVLKRTPGAFAAFAANKTLGDTAATAAREHVDELMYYSCSCARMSRCAERGGGR